jgi:hypothetical protein
MYHFMHWNQLAAFAPIARLGAGRAERCRVAATVRAQEKQLLGHHFRGHRSDISIRATARCTEGFRCTSGRKIGREDFLRRRLELGNKPAAEPGSGDTLIAIFADISTT